MDWLRGRARGTIAGGALSLAALALFSAFAAPRAEAAVYWANNASFGAGSIGRVNLDGTGYDPDFISGANDPCGVAVNSQHVFWANRLTPNSIGRARLDGAGVDQTFLPGPFALPCGPSVNQQYIYWANLGGSSGDGSIGRANLDGSGVSGNNVSGATVSDPHSTAMDDDFVYWANTDSSDASIYRQEIDAGPPQDVISGINPIFTPLWPSLSPARLFFASGTLGVGSTDREGNDSQTVTTSNAVGGTAVLGNKIYWLSRPDGNLSRANLDGSSPQFTLISGLENPLGLAIDGRRFPPFQFGALRRKKRRGTATLVVFLPEPGKLVLAGKGVRRRVFRAPEGKVKLQIRPKQGIREKLDDTGRARVRAKITHTPDGGEPGTRRKPVGLIQL